MPHPLDMLDRLILWHIMDDYLKHPGIKGTGQQMAQLRCKAAAGDCVVPGCLNIAHGALVVQPHDPVEEFLICIVFSTGQKQFEYIKVIVDIVHRGPKTLVGEGIHLTGLFGSGQLVKLL